jgi:hypothetical protein
MWREAMKCMFCEEDLEEISFIHTINGAVYPMLSQKTATILYVCTSSDCKMCGVVIAVPCE